MSRGEEERIHMFCPKCGAPLSVQLSGHGQREFWCQPGDMYLSRDLQGRLERRYGPAVASPPQLPWPPYFPQLHGGLRWYCPGDGTPLNAALECPRCGKHLRDLVYVLVELHPHRPVVRRGDHSRDT